MLDNFKGLFKKMGKKEEETLAPSSGNAARERLHLVLMQDRVNVSVDFLDLMKEEIIQVIKKYIDIDEKSIDVRLTNQINEDGSNGAPALYANIPIVGLKNDSKKTVRKKTKKAVASAVSKTIDDKELNEESIKKVDTTAKKQASTTSKKTTSSEKTVTNKDKTEKKEETKTKQAVAVQKKVQTKTVKKDT